MGYFVVPSLCVGPASSWGDLTRSQIVHSRCPCRPEMAVGAFLSDHKQDRKMIYAYVKLTVTNPDSLAQYRELAADALASHGGKVVHATTHTTSLDGTPDIPDVAVILAFPDKDAALAWIDDPELVDIHNLRRGAGKSDILLLG